MVDRDGDYLKALFKKYRKNKKWCLAGVTFYKASPEDHDRVNNIERNMIE